MARQVLQAVFFILHFSMLLKHVYTSQAPNIAVVGAGIGGASTVHFLRSLFGERGANIDVFEAKQVGGRLALAKMGNRNYETGGSIIHPKNEYMSRFATILDLQHQSPPEGRLGIYDGQEYLFTESNWEILTYFKLFWRYGSNLLKLNWFIEGLLQHFSNIYSLQDQGHAFTSVEKLLTAMNSAFVNMTQTTARSVLRQHKFSEQFIDEFLMAITRVNYGQTPDINGFVGSVALAGAESGLWSVKGGNKFVPELLLKKAQANVISARVKEIVLQNNTFKLVIENNGLENRESIDGLRGKELEEATYDLVVVATPLIENLSEIKFENFPEPIADFDGDYHRTVCTLVGGSINATSINMNVDLDAVLTTNGSVLFNSLSKIYPVDFSEGEQYPSPAVWKIFSQRPLTDEELDFLFTERTETRVIDWMAYPRYTPSEKLGTFVLYPGLYYTSSIEWAASAMEMSAIAGRNAALLAYNHWLGIPDKLDTPHAGHSHGEL